MHQGSNLISNILSFNDKPMSVPCNDVLTLKRPRYSKKMTWYLIKKMLLIHFSKPESCHDANFIVNDGIRCCQLCRHCRHRGLPSEKEITRVPIRTTSGQSWHHENSRFSMLCFGGLSLILRYTRNIVMAFLIWTYQSNSSRWLCMNLAPIGCQVIINYHNDLILTISLTHYYIYIYIYV